MRLERGKGRKREKKKTLKKKRKGRSQQRWHPRWVPPPSSSSSSVFFFLFLLLFFFSSSSSSSLSPFLFLTILLSPFYHPNKGLGRVPHSDMDRTPTWIGGCRCSIQLVQVESGLGDFSFDGTSVTFSLMKWQSTSIILVRS